MYVSIIMESSKCELPKLEPKTLLGQGQRRNLGVMKKTKTPLKPLSARRAAIRRLEKEPTTERRADTQRRLLEAGRIIITRYGVEGASVGLITKEAGFSRGAFYSNFNNMDHFVACIAQAEWERVLETIGTSLNAAIPASKTTSHQLTPESFAETLLTSTRPLLDSNEPRLDILAHGLLEAVPRDRDFYLLWTSIANFMVRDPGSSPQLRQALTNFHSGMVKYIETALDRLGLKPSVKSDDLVDIVISIAARSTRGELVDADNPDGELIDRVLPEMLHVLVQPKSLN